MCEVLSTLPIQVIQSNLIFTTAPWDRYCYSTHFPKRRIRRRRVNSLVRGGKELGHKVGSPAPSLGTVPHCVTLWLPPTM